MKKTEEKNVIFVCTGNTCRSPMAEAIFRYEAKRRGLAVSVCSAGTEAEQSRGMNINSLRTLSEHGLSIENFTPTQLTVELVDAAFAVVCMTERQKEIIANAYARWKNVPVENVKKVWAYSDFCGYSIPDPYGGSMDDYGRTFDALVGGMSAIIEKLFTEKPTRKTKKSSGTQMELPINIPTEKPKAKKPRAAGGATRKREDGAKASGKSSAKSGAKRKTATRKSVPNKE